MSSIDLSTLTSAVTAGGSSAISSYSPLRPAAGEFATVAPAKFVPARGTDSVYSYDTRFIDGEPRRVVKLDSEQSQRNRIEDALLKAVEDGNEVLSRVPRIRVSYEHDGRTEEFFDWNLPGRGMDGHIRAGKVNGVPATEFEAYRAARDSDPRNARALFDLSPVSLVMGAWDASRKARQGRWPSCLTGEIFGVLADQQMKDSPVKGGGRVDPVGMSVQLEGPVLLRLLEAQRDELSPTTYEKLAKEWKKLKPGELKSASALGLGAIPPSLSALGGVSCSRIVRSHVLSFAALRQIRFGGTAESDASLRAVLAAFAINGVVRSDAELYLRANCHLVEAGPTVTELDRRHGEHERLELPTLEEADSLLAEAIEQANRKAGLHWHGQILEVQGDPAILAGGSDGSDGESA